MYKYKFIVFFFIYFQAVLIGNESFYAISSLSYYFENRVEEDFINFDQAKIEDLWKVAFQEPLTVKLVEKARYQSEQGNNARALQFLMKAWSQLSLDYDKGLELDESYDFAYPYTRHNYYYPNFNDNPLITKEMRQRMERYLVPLRHYLKPRLDKIFLHTRVVESDLTLSQAGFLVRCIAPSSHLRISSHPSIEGYIFKLPIDSDLRKKKGRPAWDWLADRCKGAENVRKLIKKEKLVYFVVPDKWIYPLPALPAPQTTEVEQQPIVLIATDMELVSYDESRQAWRTVITHEHLDELYCILSHGYSSGCVIINIPFTIHGKFACVDTEYPQRKPRFASVRNFLSDEMLAYWDELIQSGGKIRKK